MTQPTLPVDVGVLSVYLRPGEAAGTRIVAIEDLLGWVREGVPQAQPLVVAGADAQDVVVDVPEPPAPQEPPPIPLQGGAAVVPLAAEDLDPVLATVRLRGDLTVQVEVVGHNFRVGGDLILPFAPSWVKIGAPDADLLRAVNRYLRVRRPSSTKTTPAYKPAPPLVAFGTKRLPYVRAVAEHPHFERWLNELFGESGNAGAQELVVRILQGSDAHSRPIFRRLPRTVAEEAQRAAAPNEWLAGEDAVDAIRVLLPSTFLVMAPVAAGARGDLLPLIGPNGGGFANDLAVAYHSTGRAPAAVLATGTARTLSIPGRPQAIGAMNAWSPYHAAQGYNDEAYFRTGQRDNDLQTVVSIAQSPFAALDFPLVHGMLDAAVGYNAAGAAEDRTVYQTPFGQVEIRRDSATECWVYVVLVDRIYDTASLQGGDAYVSPSTEADLEGAFDARGELATDVIPANQHVLAVRYERLHFGLTRESGMRYRAVEFMSLRPFGGPPGPEGLTMDERIAQWLVTMPLCGVKRGVRMSDAQYRERLREAIGVCADPPDRQTMFADYHRRLQTIYDQIAGGADPVAHQAAIAGLTGTIADADAALQHRWLASVENLRTALRDAP
jgi:hypothetical protein